MATTPPTTLAQSALVRAALLNTAALQDVAAVATKLPLLLAGVLAVDGDRATDRLRRSVAITPAGTLAWAEP